jgi:flagellar basal body-associated protein FliL
LYSCGTNQQVDTQKGGTERMSILWIILIVILVLALLGFFSRGYW